jgi:D-proline reductase (dithiol) PrdB
MACARDITASAFPPRAVFSNYPLGNPAGRPFDPENQRAVIGAALELLERAPGPGTIVDLPYRWSDDDGWMARVYDDNH